MIPLPSAPRKKFRHTISCLPHSSRTHRSLYWRGSTLWLELFCWPSRNAQCSASLLAIRCRVTSRVCTSNSASGETTRFGTWSICAKVKQTRKTQANQAKHKKKHNVIQEKACSWSKCKCNEGFYPVVSVCIRNSNGLHITSHMWNECKTNINTLSNEVVQIKNDVQEK